MLTLERVPLYNKDMVIFTRRSAHSARMAGPKIALRSPHLSVYFFVCLCVCTYHVRIMYVICYYATAVYESRSDFWLCIYSRFAGHCKLQQMKVVVCCLHGENVVGSCKDPVFVAN